MYKNVREASKALKEIMVSNRETKGTLKDYDRLVICYLMGNFKPMFGTKLYLKHSAEYCEALCHVDGIADKLSEMIYISNYMDIDMLKGYFEVDSKVPAYGGTIDTVIGFRTDVKIWGWAVDVKGNDGVIRSHSTTPSQVRDLKARRALLLE